MVEVRKRSPQKACPGGFVWSFYENRSILELSAAILRFAKEAFDWLPESNNSDSAREIFAVLEFLRCHATCLVLDGMEVIQGSRRSDRYGQFLNQDLAELLVGLAQKQEGLTLLTSRFPFADLNSFRGLGFAEIQLPRLSPQEGATVLLELGVVGDREALESASSTLNGHPLALRVLAASTKREAVKGLGVTNVICTLGEDKFSKRLQRLLRFYTDGLLEREKRLVSLVALFPSPIGREALVTLGRKLKDPVLQHADLLDSALVAMERDGILLRESGTDTWSVHPIIRDHIRADDLAAAAADFLAGRPFQGQAKDIEGIRDSLDAIMVLCDAGMYGPALDLFKSRCERGRIFSRLGAMREGYEISMRFVQPDAQKQFSAQDQVSAMNTTGLMARAIGDLSMAAAMHKRAAEILMSVHAPGASSVCLINLSNVLRENLPISEAVHAAEQALDVAEQAKDSLKIGAARAALAWRLAEAGKALEAAKHVSFAYELLTVEHPTEQGKVNVTGPVYNIGMVLLVLGRLGPAAIVFRQDAAFMMQLGSMQYAQWSMKRAAESERDSFSDMFSMRRLLEAARAGGAALNMADAYVELSSALLHQNDAKGAVEAAKRAIEIAGPRRLLRAHAAGLAALGMSLAALGSGIPAQQAAEDSLATARPLGNRVVEREALKALASAAKALGKTDAQDAAELEISKLGELLVWPEKVVLPKLGIQPH